MLRVFSLEFQQTDDERGEWTLVAQANVVGRPHPRIAITLALLAVKSTKQHSRC